MTTVANERQAVDSFEIAKEIEISAPIATAFEAMLEQLGPEGRMPGDTPFPMKIEPWPGGRWFRDLGNNAGHLWGHVQVIKPPNLLEICGPLMLSMPAANHLQYRFKADGSITRLSFTHRAIGLAVSQFRDDMSDGWGYWLERIRDLAQRKSGK